MGIMLTVGLHSSRIFGKMTEIFEIFLIRLTISCYSWRLDVWPEEKKTVSLDILVTISISLSQD